MKRIKDIKTKAQEFAEDVKESLDSEQNHSQKGASQPNQPFYQRKTSHPEEFLETIWSWFAMLWIGIFVALAGIVLALSNTKFWPFAIILFIGLLVWIPFCIFMMIPDIKILGFTLFSRRKLGIRQSLTVGSRLSYTLSREFFRQNPGWAFLLFAFFILIFVSIVIALI